MGERLQKAHGRNEEALYCVAHSRDCRTATFISVNHGRTRFTMMLKVQARENLKPLESTDNFEIYSGKLTCNPKGGRLNITPLIYAGAPFGFRVSSRSEKAASGWMPDYRPRTFEGAQQAVMVFGKNMSSEPSP